MKPINQLKLFGFKNIFDELININNNDKFPNKILFSGYKGIGKTTFVYHLINYFLSQDEEDKYDSNENIINKLVQENYHHNFFNIEIKDEKKNIEISQIREMINFTNKSSFDNKNKIILIDNVEYLNKNSLNALLKVIEEPNNKVLFFLIHNNEKRIFQTLKSRCIEFKLKLENKYVHQIVNYFLDEHVLNSISPDFTNFYTSPSNYINFISFCKKNELDYCNISIEKFIKYIIKNNIYKKDIFIRNNIKFYIELFFLKKISFFYSSEIFDLFNYFNKKFDIFIKFNLDLESFFLEFNSKLLNE